MLSRSGEDVPAAFAAAAFAVFNQGIVERQAFLEEWFVEHGLVLLLFLSVSFDVFRFVCCPGCFVSGENEPAAFAAAAFAVFGQMTGERQAFLEEWFVEHGLVLLLFWFLFGFSDCITALLNYCITEVVHCKGTTFFDTSKLLGIFFR